MGRKKGITLPMGIIMIVFLTVLSTAAVNGYSAYHVHKQSLEKNYLENNYQYAAKISADANVLITAIQQNINSIAEQMSTDSLSEEELNIWSKANEPYFNSIFITNEDSVIQSVSPNVPGMKAGERLDSLAIKAAAEMKKPLISEPYIGVTGRLIVLVSAPIFDDGRFAGIVAGSIYLEEDNVLNRLLDKHFYKDGSYIYVVGRSGNLIFHPDKGRLNDSVIRNQAVRQVLSGESGSMVVTNTIEKPFFAGYKHVGSTGWGIVAQTPTSVIDAPLKQLIKEIILKSFPLLLLILLSGWLAAYFISKPLNRLAKFSEEAIASDNKFVQPITSKHESKIYEVRQLYFHVNNHLNFLSTEMQNDGLTGLANRKTFNIIIEDWLLSGKPFSLILLDVDNFKEINDTFGHVNGDKVLRHLARLMKEVIGRGNISFRYGGEEFCVLVNSNEATAYTVAEKLRQEMERRASPIGREITISLGVAHVNQKLKSSEELIAKADMALYQAKRAGKNQTVISKE